MNITDWILIGVIAAALIGAVILTVRKRKHGNSCCGNCSSCCGCSGTPQGKTKSN